MYLALLSFLSNSRQFVVIGSAEAIHLIFYQILKYMPFCNLIFTALLANSVDDKLVFFLFFCAKLGFDTSSNLLSPRRQFA